MLERVPEPQRELAREALRQSIGESRVTSLSPVFGGASGALTYRVEAGDRAYLLRIESGMNALANPHHYPCMQAAAEAGIAPPLRYLDARRGVVLMDFVTPRPPEEFPGGPPALVREMGSLIRRLQDTAKFPAPRMQYLEVMGRMLGELRRSNVFAHGLLDAHASGFERIRAAYPWDESALVASHNDVNPRNVLFDGARLWLIDWETAYANDPLTDPALVTHELATTPEFQEILLRAWLGREPDRGTRARLVLMRQITRMYYVCLIFRQFAGDAGRTPDPSTTALTPAEFVAAIQAGRLRLGTPEVLYEFGKMFLAGFSAGLEEADFEESLANAAR